ncbi:Tetratricopeptide repeat-containing protein [Pseudoxanthomonas sp. GM95]|uniref:tetratricopeptide repeat protein n=1 Tax=Pseudoxanthomonas sp. GM95 TaxID=1881043 RepID=UPI0008D3BE9E|nr:tetratricopeptide repeat protein [Pseudoxanthomonas sp. GM95]SEL66740.1 Tetratricopeptide repeat-containing protein [Pseudoxanthomonas sp. GM95]
MNTVTRLALTAALLLPLAACVTEPAPAPTPAPPKLTPTQALNAVLAVAKADDRELAIQPVRDPEVEDLREASVAAQKRGDWKASAEALNQALLISPEDPAVLQERAEVALALGEWDRAETLSRKALELGSKTGPLCRRHWATIEQSQLARNQDQNAASAHAQIASCTVAGFDRM